MDVVTNLVTAPTTYPVTLNEVRDFARIDHTLEDNRISSVWIPAATKYAQDCLKRQLMPATWRMTMSRFPRGRGIIEVPNPPLVSVTSIYYVDSAGTSTLISSSDYQVDTDSEPGRIAPARGESWPEPDSETLNAVLVTLVAGYGPTDAEALTAMAAKAPEIKLAILTLCTHWYDRRGIDADGSITSETRHSLDAMLRKERMEPPSYEDC